MKKAQPFRTIALFGHLFELCPPIAVELTFRELVTETLVNCTRQFLQGMLALGNRKKPETFDHYQTN